MAKKYRRKSKPASPDARKTVEKAEALHESVERMEHTAEEVHRAIDRVHQKAKKVHKKIRKSLERASSHGDFISGKSFPIVGIGASAGGLEAATELLENLPADTGMAFVLVQHLDPTHESALTSLLARATKDARDRGGKQRTTRPNRLYSFADQGHRNFQPPAQAVSARRRQRGIFSDRPLFYSLATHNGDNIAGIILSGNGSDGTKGLLAIKAAGGITFATGQKIREISDDARQRRRRRLRGFCAAAEKIAGELQHIAGRLGELPPHEAESGTAPASEERAFEGHSRPAAPADGGGFHVLQTPDACNGGFSGAWFCTNWNRSRNTAISCARTRARSSNCSTMCSSHVTGFFAMRRCFTR